MIFEEIFQILLKNDQIFVTSMKKFFKIRLKTIHFPTFLKSFLKIYQKPFQKPPK